MFNRDLRAPLCPSLPFDDEITISPKSRSEQPQPTAFITYAHETPEHDKRVLDLADQLETEGIRCDLDVFELCPPEGWPTWMFRQVETRDFCIVVCTETYRRRMEGRETPGKGKGVTFESRIFLQRLYDAQTYDWLLPVVFEEADIPNIPSVLKSATYYVLGTDLETDGGYTRLYRALTKQPFAEHRTNVTIRRCLPHLDAIDSRVAALLNVCPHPVPPDVIAQVVVQAADALRATLQGLVDRSIVCYEKGLVRLVDPSARGIPEASDEIVDLTLGAVLNYVRSSSRDQAQAQVMNGVALARTVTGRTSVHVSRSFRVLQSFLKSLGNKRLVLETARRSMDTAQAFAEEYGERETERVEDEAIAAICGVSWVYQRTGRLSEAFDQAQHSLGLGEAIHWATNTAFCHKCMGRLRRLEAEEDSNEQERGELLRKSAGLLQTAISEFTSLDQQLEVGDCYSLLARTHLSANHLSLARNAIKEADTRLVEPGTKDYIDLNIVKADLLARSSRHSGEAMYTEIISTGDDKDAQKSEIFARAYLHRGRVRARLGARDKALADFRQAARIWDDLQDPTADDAHWEMERAGDWFDKRTELLLQEEPVGVRVRVARMAKEGQSARGEVRSQRATLPTNYVRGLIAKAREKLVKERARW